MIEVEYEPVMEMKRRFEVKQTPRAALINFMKDEMRIRLADGSFAQRSSDALTYFHIAMDFELRNLWQSCGVYTSMWSMVVTPFGTEIKLSDFGQWMLKARAYMSNLTDAQYDRMLKEAMKKAGV